MKKYQVKKGKETWFISAENVAKANEKMLKDYSVECVEFIKDITESWNCLFPPKVIAETKKEITIKKEKKDYQKGIGRMFG